ncbi:MAG: Gfo/Idh/MocA family oxidoreductase, partial [Planctomycetota bacterium]|nr:Gfo/Idh/MocA family oxidoreductase [Planctomycetota bacterium]
MSYRLGLIGAGTIGKLHAESAARAGVEVAGFCDTEPQRLKEMAAQYPEAMVTSSFQELLEADDIEAVVVGVPNSLHKECAIAAMEAGKDVLLEKPMAMNAAECDEIIDAMKRTGRLVQLGFVCRCAPTTRALMEFIAAGRLGRIYHARAAWVRRRGIPGLGRWFTTKSEAGGGVLIDLGVHMIDLIMHLAGRPKALRAGGSCTSTFGAPIDKYVYTEMFAGPPNPKGKFDVEDAAMGMIRFDDGLTMELALSWAANVPEHLLTSGITLLGEKGGCFYDIWTDRFVIATEQDGHLVDISPHLGVGISSGGKSDKSKLSCLPNSMTKVAARATWTS